MTLLAERARPEDVGAALELLRSADLPTQGVTGQFGHYFVARDAGRVVGLAGLEVHGGHGLLRSAVVDPAYRGDGTGGRLVEAVLGLAARLELDAVYLLTTTARDYFARLGFEDCPRSDAPLPIQESWEYRHGCPESASFMRRSVSGP